VRSDSAWTRCRPAGPAWTRPRAAEEAGADPAVEGHSRYDVFLYTYTTAKLSYQETPVLVQVSLLHKGGIAGGAPAAHAEGVLRGEQEYVDQFSTRIRDANK
jgi:hypothetical protein